MPALLAVAAAASLAAASAPSRSLPYDSIRDPLVMGAAGAAWLLSQVFEEQLASPACRWCDPPTFDAAVRDRLRWRDPAAAGIASDVLAYGAVPLLGLGVDFFVSGREANTSGGGSGSRRSDSGLRLARALQRLAGRLRAVAATRPARLLLAVLVREPRPAQLMEGADAAVVAHLAEGEGGRAARWAARGARHLDQALQAALVTLPHGRDVAPGGGAERALRLRDAARVVAASSRVEGLALLELGLGGVQIATRHGPLDRVAAECGIDAQAGDRDDRADCHRAGPRGECQPARAELVIDRWQGHGAKEQSTAHRWACRPALSYVSGVPPRLRAERGAAAYPATSAAEYGGDWSVQHAQLVQPGVQFGGVAVDAIGAGADQLVLAIAAAQHADAQHGGAPGGEEVPDGVADHVAVLGRDAETLLAGEEEVGGRLRAAHVASLHHHHVPGHLESGERRVDLRPPARGGDAVRDSGFAQPPEQGDGAGQRPALGQELPEQLAVPALQRLRLIRREIVADLARHRAGEQAAAHAHAPVDPPAVDGHARLVERLLPGEDVGVDGVDQGAVEVEDERPHRAFRRADRRFRSGRVLGRLRAIRVPPGGNVLDRGLTPHRLREEAHQLQELRRHVGSHLEAELLRHVDGDGEVVRPGPRREELGELARLLRRLAAGEQLAGALPQLEERLLGHVREDQRLVVHVGDRLPRHRFHHRGRGVLSQLRVDGTQDGVGRHHDLVGRQADQRPAGHRVVRPDVAGIIDLLLRRWVSPNAAVRLGFISVAQASRGCSSAGAPQEGGELLR